MNDLQGDQFIVVRINGHTEIQAGIPTCKRLSHWYQTDSIASFHYGNWRAKGHVTWILTNQQAAWWCNALQFPWYNAPWNPSILCTYRLVHQMFIHSVPTGTHMIQLLSSFSNQIIQHRTQLLVGLFRGTLHRQFSTFISPGHRMRLKCLLGQTFLMFYWSS